MPLVTVRARVVNADEEIGPDTGFPALEQAVLDCVAGDPVARATGPYEEVLFVVGGRGELRLDGGSHPLEAETGVHLAPGENYELDGDLRMVSVRIPDPVEPSESRQTVRRLADQTAQDATAGREFRIVAGIETGLNSATHFVGYIPVGRAPDHFHTYDEVIYVLDGTGEFHAHGESWPLRAGSCIQLPARTVHCLENSGSRPMRVLAVFRPAGSPAAAYYPDGTPAYENP